MISFVFWRNIARWCIILVGYDEYIKDETDRIIYEDYFEQLYYEMKGYLEAKGGPKQMPPLNIPQDQSVFTAHISGSSMMGVLYDVGKSTINYHLHKLYEDGEIEENSVVRKFRTTAERQKILDTVNSEEFASMPPCQQ